MKTANPYLNRVAIKDPGQFFGRAREVSKIFSRIGASRPQSISVVGERRIGKSSLLCFINHPQVRERFLDRPESYVFAFIDLQQKRRLTLTEFFKELFALLGKETGDKSLTRLQPSFDSLRSMLDNFRRDGRKLVVLLDEFDAITTNRAFDLEFYSFLRSIANNYDVAYVTSSARDLQELCHTQLIADSPFFNIFTNVFLRAFTRKEAVELITRPSAEAGLPLEGYARRIMEIGGYFPYFLQIACSAYFDYLVENDGKLDREEVEATFLDEAKGQFRFIWDHLSDGPRRAIREVMEHGRVEKEHEHIYEDLKRAGYFIHDDRGPRIFSTLFASVVSRPRVITTELRETDRAAMAVHDGKTEKVVAPPLIEPEGHIGRFEIRRSLGAGGMGEIFESYDTDLQRTVAIKVLASKHIEDESMKQRFLREAQMASQLNHPNIATIHEIGEATGNPYIVMEYVEGQTVAERLETGPLPLRDVIEIGIQSAEALAEAHECGVVHRDIKSSNIMITPRGKAKVLDFGLAKPLPILNRRSKSRLTESGVLLGTVSYMSPEQATAQADVTHLTDIFSLGVVLYEMTTGKLPFEGETYFQTIEAIRKRAPSAINKHRKDAPDALATVIERMLEKDPHERYQSASEVARDLQNAVKSFPSDRVSDRG
ncbi:MAG TPA: protein kinase [Blastocatellia bacterium]|nr:protein kinase [Blastocatellia bacterium]